MEKNNLIQLSDPLVSLIIRVKNEERWITACLRAVYNQSYKNIEVVIVDNCSTDRTLDLAKQFPVKIINIDDFLPGRAINEGIRNSNGEYIVCLSGHCIPTNTSWLRNLIRDLYDPLVAGVYGRQEPLAFSSDLDKRDLITVFGLDKKIQIKDSFFHNANSAFRREIWNKYPFDENVTNIEDRVWGQKLINEGMKIIYEPEASVFHWHGIHHNLNPDRARKIVRIMEGLNLMETEPSLEHIKGMNIVAIIPVRGSSCQIRNRHLLEYTLMSAHQSKLINTVVVSTDSPETAELAKSFGACVPFIRPDYLSEDYFDVSDVLKYTLNEFDRLFQPPDLIVLLEETYPFRRPDLIDQMILYLVKNGLDSLVAAKPETRGLLIENGDSIKLLDDGFMPTSLKESKALVGLMGLASIAYPSLIRGGNFYGQRMGVFEVRDLISTIQVRDQSSTQLAEKLIGDWWDTYYGNQHFG